MGLNERMRLLYDSTSSGDVDREGNYWRESSKNVKIKK